MKHSPKIITLESTFDEVFDYLKNLPNNSIGDLTTTGRKPMLGVKFSAHAKTNGRGKHILCLSGKSSRTYIYKDTEDWVKSHNSSGTRIAHYTVPIDQWYSRVKD